MENVIDIFTREKVDNNQAQRAANYLGALYFLQTGKPFQLRKGEDMLERLMMDLPDGSPLTELTQCLAFMLTTKRAQRCGKVPLILDTLEALSFNLVDNLAEGMKTINPQDWMSEVEFRALKEAFPNAV